MVKLTATAAARGFSEALNRVAAGEEFEIVRNGATAADLREIRSSVGFDEEPWPSS